MDELKDNSTGESGKKEKVDIFSMLSKAQEDYNKSLKQEIPSYTPGPRVSEVTSSVMDFFAKATNIKGVPTAVVPGLRENMLQKLMSNPALSVEHIEKQQRALTPQEPTKGIANSVNFPSTSERKIFIDNGVKLGSSGTKTPSVMQSISPLAFFLQQSQQSAPKKQESREFLCSSPFGQMSDSSRPHLMTPMMFTKSTPIRNVEVSSSDQDQVDFLTEKQLAQALIYLLKNNSEFTKLIHEAYIKSLTEKVNFNNNRSFI